MTQGNECKAGGIAKRPRRRRRRRRRQKRQRRKAAARAIPSHSGLYMFFCCKSHGDDHGKPYLSTGGLQTHTERPEMQIPSCGAGVWRGGINSHHKHETRSRSLLLTSRITQPGAQTKASSLSSSSSWPENKCQWWNVWLSSPPELNGGHIAQDDKGAIGRNTGRRK